MTMQNQRSSFSRQPARMLMVDLSKPFDVTTCGILKEALCHFFSLTCSISGPCRLPFFGLFALGSYPEALFPLQNLVGNYGRLQNALGELEVCAKAVGGNTGPHGSVTQGIQEATIMFRRQAQNLLQTAGYWTQLEITVVTCQAPSKVIRQIEKATQDITLDSLKKVQVLHINNSERVQNEDEVEVSGSQSSSDRSQNSDGGLVDWISLDEDVFCLENFLKSWLQDCSTDMEQLHLHIPSSDGPDLVLKCDLHERLLSPHQLPVADKFVVRCDSPLLTKPGSQSVTKGSGHQVSLYKIHVIKKLSAQSVCESVLFDMPMIVRPTTCWKMDWDDLETNQQHFVALCHLLKQKDQVLLAVLEEEVPPTKRAPSFRYQVAAPVLLRPHFLLLPSHSGALLLKPLAVSELTMPCDLGAGDKPVNGSLELVGQYLEKLTIELIDLDYRRTLDVEEGESYNPLTSSSNLYQCLETRLKSAPGGGAGGTGTKRKSTTTYPSSFQSASSVLGVRPVGPVKATNFSSTLDRRSSRNVQPSTSSKTWRQSHTQPSGKDFYGKNTTSSDFPTEL